MFYLAVLNPSGRKRSQYSLLAKRNSASQILAHIRQYESKNRMPFKRIDNIHQLTLLKQGGASSSLNMSEFYIDYFTKRRTSK